MPKLNSLETLLVQEIKDLYSAETQLVKALPKMEKAAANPQLKEAIAAHLEQTKVQVERLEKIADILEVTPRGKVCKAMKGLVEEGEEMIKEEGDPAILDLGIISAAQKVEHYEISGYGSARALAEALEYNDIASILQETLDEEGQTDKDLTALAETIVPEAVAVGA